MEEQLAEYEDRYPEYFAELNAVEEKGRAWCVVLDTNVIYQDYRLRSQGLSSLVRACRISEVRIILPAVTYSELASHYINRIKGAYEDARKKTIELERYSYLEDMSLKPPDLDTSLLSKGYSSWLKKRANELGIEVSKYPETSHESIMARSAEHRKPFKGDRDIGYKDTLIWETIVEIIRDEGLQVILISQNYRDFAEADNQTLHRDLGADLQELGVAHSAVRVIKSYEDALVLLDEQTTIESGVSLAKFIDDEKMGHEWNKSDIEKNLPLVEILGESNEYIAFELESHLENFPNAIHPVDVRLSYGEIQSEYEVDDIKHVGNDVYLVRATVNFCANVKFRDIRALPIDSEREELMNLQVLLTLYYDAVVNDAYDKVIYENPIDQIKEIKVVGVKRLP